MMRICIDLPLQHPDLAFPAPALPSTGEFDAIFVKDIKQPCAFPDSYRFGQRDQPDGVGFQKSGRKLL
jgi:hypothetical protein